MGNGGGSVWMSDRGFMRKMEIGFNSLVVPGQAGGGSFRGERSFRPKKEFAYRIGAGPTKNYQVLHLSSTPCYKVLLCTTT